MSFLIVFRFEIILEADVDNTSEKNVANHVDESCLTFKYDQCAYTNSSEKGLGQHTRMKQRISQLDGNNYFGEEDSESINVVAMTYMISAKERKTLKEVTKDLETRRGRPR